MSKILSFKLFGDSWGTLYIPYLLLVIALRLTCGEKKIWSNIKKCQNIMTRIVALTSPDRFLSISFFANLHRTTETTWSICSLLILKEYKVIIHSKASFEFSKISPLFSGLLLSQTKCLLCYANSSISFFKN